MTPIPRQGAELGSKIRKSTPPIQEIDAAGLINSKFEFYQEILDVVPLKFYGSDIEVLEQNLRGDVGPVGADVKVLKKCFILFYSESEHLQEELAC